jgi:hypothetical protein
VRKEQVLTLQRKIQEKYGGEIKKSSKMLE